MYETRLEIDKAAIRKIREPMPFNRAEMKFFSFVAHDQLSIPDMDRLLQERDPREARAGVRRAVSRMVDTLWESGEIRNIRKGHEFQFGDTGKTLHLSQTKTPPRRVDWVMLLVEIDRDIRDLGGAVADSVSPPRSPRADRRPRLARGPRSWRGDRPGAFRPRPRRGRHAQERQ